MAVVFWLEEFRHIDSLEFRECFDAIQPASPLPFPLCNSFRNLKNYFLSITKDKSIEELSHWLWIECIRSATNNQRQVWSPVSCKEWDPTQLQHGEYIGIAQLILEAESHQIK